MLCVFVRVTVSPSTCTVVSCMARTTVTSTTVSPSTSWSNNSNGFFIADKRKRKIKVCLSAVENPLKLLIQEWEGRLVLNKDTSMTFPQYVEEKRGKVKIKSVWERICLPVTNPRPSSSCSTFSLLRACFTDPEFFESLHFTWRIVTHFFNFPTVCNKPNSIYGDWCFRNICGNYALADTVRRITEYLRKFFFIVYHFILCK